MRSEQTKEHTVLITEKIQKVLTFYNLGKSYLCKIVGIPHPVLSSWLDRSSEPTAEQFAKIEQLYKLSNELDTTGNHSIYHGYIDNPLPGESLSLYELLIKNTKLDTDVIKKLTTIAYTKSLCRTKNIEKRRIYEFQVTHSKPEEELNFERNL